MDGQKMTMNEVTLVSTEERHAVSIQGRVKMSDIPQFVGRAYSEIWMEMKRNGWEIAGPPFAFYRSCSDGEVDLDCGFPVKGEAVGADRARPFTLPAVKAARALHKGPYMELVRTYEMVERWIKAKGLEPADQMWEYYLNDPAMVSPEELMTEIIWPIK
jgi:effector-binding domain-containing protein